MKSAHRPQPTSSPKTIFSVFFLHVLSYWQFSIWINKQKLAQYHRNIYTLNHRVQISSYSLHPSGNLSAPQSQPDQDNGQEYVQFSISQNRRRPLQRRQFQRGRNRFKWVCAISRWRWSNKVAQPRKEHRCPQIGAGKCPAWQQKRTGQSEF